MSTNRTRVENPLLSILEIGKRDLTNAKYDDYFNEAWAALELPPKADADQGPVDREPDGSLAYREIPVVEETPSSPASNPVHTSAQRIMALARFGALIAHNNLFDRTVNINEEPTEGHEANRTEGDPFGFKTCPYPDCAMFRLHPPASAVSPTQPADCAACDTDRRVHIEPRKVLATTPMVTLVKARPRPSNESSAVSPREEPTSDEVIAAMKSSLQDWLKANAPGGWIDDLRQRANRGASVPLSPENGKK